MCDKVKQVLESIPYLKFFKQPDYDLIIWSNGGTNRIQTDSNGFDAIFLPVPTRFSKISEATRLNQIETD